MIIDFDSNLYRDPRNFDKLDKILDLIISDRHEGIIKDFTIEDTEWFKDARSIKKDFIKELLIKSASSNKEPNFILSDKNEVESNIFTLIDGLIFLENKVLIFLENSYNDEKFIRSLFSKFKEGERSNTFLKKGWIEIKNCAGSGGVVKQIYAELRKYRDRELENHKYIKAFVLIDSDKKYPLHYVDKSQIINCCKEFNIDLHILEKREMENYLPISILELDKNVESDKIEALKSLSDVQLDYYDLDEGFDVTSINQLHGKYNNLYKGISSKVFKELRTGLKNKDFNTKNKIPELFLKNELTSNELIDKCRHQNNPNELIDIIKKIDKLN